MQKRAGFTLLELGLVLIVASLLISGAMSLLNQNIRLAKKTELKEKMDAIESALQGFRKANNRIPCPGDITFAGTNINFGVPFTAGCAGAIFGDGGNIVGGTVPVRALDLPDDYAYDPWGGRFFYIVDKRFTNTGAFSSYTLTTYNMGAVIRDSAGNDIVTPTATTHGAIAIVISHGANGHGAYQANGSPKFSGSTNAHEQTNCVCDADSISGSPSTDLGSTFYIHAPSSSMGVNTDPLDLFDDVGRYYLRTNLRNASELAIP